MSLDIRIPIGLMFSIIGLILAIFSFVSDPKIYARSLGILGVNINLVWGCVLVVFGAFMLLMAVRAQRRGKKG